MSRAPGRSQHLCTGPTLDKGRPFDVQVAIHAGMGPGGMLWRWDDAAEWSSMSGCSSWGAEELNWPVRWSVGHIGTILAVNHFEVLDWELQV